MRSTTMSQPVSSVRSLFVLCVGLLVLVGFGGPAFGQSASENETASASPAATVGLSMTDIRHALSEHRVALRGCFASDNLPPRVEFLIDFTVRMDGTVGGTAILESNADNVEIDDCVVDVFEMMRFAEPTNGRGYSVHYPMIFVPST